MAASDENDRTEPGAQVSGPVPSQPYLDDQLHGKTSKKKGQPAEPTGRPDIDAAASRIRREAPVPVAKLPEEVRQSVRALHPGREREVHGSKYSLAYFPGPWRRRACGDRFGYLSSDRTRQRSKLPFNPANRALLTALGEAMAATQPDRPASANSILLAGMTYVGQFVDHDITLDVSSTLDIATDANTIHNMRSPSLDLDNVDRRGPVLDPFLYDLTRTKAEWRPAPSGKGATIWPRRISSPGTGARASSSDMCQILPDAAAGCTGFPDPRDASRSFGQRHVRALSASAIAADNRSPMRATSRC